jgi:hypothetical protein
MIFLPKSGTAEDTEIMVLKNYAPRREQRWVIKIEEMLMALLYG